jgi:hypothetical protein
VQSALKPLFIIKQNEALWHKMNERLGIGSKTKLPYFISDESTQQGFFGDKLSHAIQSVLIEVMIKLLC